MGANFVAGVAGVALASAQARTGDPADRRRGVQPTCSTTGAPPGTGRSCGPRPATRPRCFWPRATRGRPRCCCCAPTPPRRRRPSTPTSPDTAVAASSRSPRWSAPSELESLRAGGGGPQHRRGRRRGQGRAGGDRGPRYSGTEPCAAALRSRCRSCRGPLSSGDPSPTRCHRYPDAMAGKTDGRQLRWDSHNQARRQHILDAAIGVLADAEPGRRGARPADRRPRRAEPDRRLPPLRRPRRPRRRRPGPGARAAARRAGAGAVLRGHPARHHPADRLGVRRVGERPPLAARVRPAGPARARRRADGAGDPADRRPDRGPHQRRASRCCTCGSTRTRSPRSTRWSSGWSGACSPSTRRWLSRPDQQPARETVRRAGDRGGLAPDRRAWPSGRGVELDPDVPVEQLLDAAFDGAAG